MNTPERDFLTDDNTDTMIPPSHSVGKTQAIEYAKVAKLAYDTVQEVMRQGEADGKDGWEKRGVCDAVDHARDHIIEFNDSASSVFNSGSGAEEEHARHALTRCAMAYYLWLKENPAENAE